MSYYIMMTLWQWYLLKLRSCLWTRAGSCCLLMFFIPIIEATLFTFKECTPTCSFSHNKNQAASSTSHLIIMKYHSKFYFKGNKQANKSTQTPTYQMFPLKLKKCLGNAEPSLWNQPLTSALLEISQNCQRTEIERSSHPVWAEGEARLRSCLVCPLCKHRLFLKDLWTVCCFSSNLKPWACGKPWFRKCEQHRSPRIPFSEKEASC